VKWSQLLKSSGTSKSELERERLMGYKRLTWQMADEDVACLRPYQVYAILHDLLHCRPVPPAKALKRPPERDHGDETWHVDLMYCTSGCAGTTWRTSWMATAAIWSTGR
jgi:hypothetical protein